VTVIVVKMPYGFMKPSKYLGRWSKITTLKAQVLTSIFFAQREFLGCEPVSGEKPLSKPPYTLRIPPPCANTSPLGSKRL